MKTTLLAIALAISVPGVACNEPVVGVPESMKVSRPLIDSVLADGPAAAAFANLSSLVAQGKHQATGFGVYKVASVTGLPTRVTQRQHSLGLDLATTSPRRDSHAVRIQQGDWTLNLTDYGDGEEFVNTGRNHRGASTPVDNLPKDSEFITAAMAHISEALAVPLARADAYPYRLRKYFNGLWSADAGTQTDGVYQVTAVFNSQIDGLPVIGPGGKLAVDMTPGLEVVRHQHSVREKGPLIHVISGINDLVTPRAAEVSVNNRLDARGIDRSRFSVSRREFGYFERANGRVQTILVPHYAFFFDPVPGTISKILVEIEPATNDRVILGLLASDERAEISRKAPTIARPDTGRAVR